MSSARPAEVSTPPGLAAAQALLARTLTPSPRQMDRNGHMNVGQYGVLFDDVFSAMCCALGEPVPVTQAFHIAYRREVLLGQGLRMELHVLGQDPRQVHYLMSLVQRDTGAVAASYEALAACTRGGDIGTWSPAMQSALQAWTDEAPERPRPGRGQPPGGLQSAAPRPMPPPSDAPDGAAIAAMLTAIDFTDMVVTPDQVDADGNLLPARLCLVVNEVMRRLAWGGLGMGAVTAQTLGLTAFVLESQLVTRRRLRTGDPLAFDYVLLDVDEKRSLGTVVIRHRTEGWEAARMDQLSISVDVATRRTTAWHPTTRARIEALRAAHAPRAQALGRLQPISLEAGHPAG